METYLDTCLVSGLTKADLRPSQQEALFQLLQAHKSRRIALVTSHITREELLKVPAEGRAQHEVIYALLEDVPPAREFRETTYGEGTYGSGTYGGRGEAPVLSRLKTILPDALDARHVFQALENGVDYFTTDDTRTIVSRRSEIEARYSIKVRLPSELVDELGL